jgi:hypothetical protein
MIGYDPAAQAIRDKLGLPYATGADEPPDWHNHPGMTGPDTWHDQCPRCPLCGDHRHGGPCSQPEARPAA